MLIRTFFRSLLALSFLLMVSEASARMPDIAPGTPTGAEQEVRSPITHRANCRNATATRFQNINNVRALLTTGGDVWWNGSNGSYIVPNVSAGEEEVSSIFAGAVWLGGRDPAGNLKVAAQQYGRSEGNGLFDYYPGPLDPEGVTTEEICAQWDRFFVVTAEEILEHQRLFQASLNGELIYTVDMIPEGVRGWPGKGNPYFFDIYKFELPSTSQPLGGFYEYCEDDGECLVDNVYNPLQGDYPIIEIEKCLDLYNPDPQLRDKPQFADEMFFWIYNDAGNAHRNSGAQDGLDMEVQVQSFAYATNDALNNMTFQRYRLINRGKELLRDTYFGIWIDGDLGCSEDDYIGCDTTRSLAYYYNVDPVDGISPGSTCRGVPTYGNDVPLIGIDYFRGPKEQIRVFDELIGDTVTVDRELGMSSFTYFVRSDAAGAPQGMHDPTTGRPQEFYNLISGLWRDGTPYTVGGTGYQTGGEVVRYAFPTEPNVPAGPGVWSCCSENLGEADRRTIQASGPFTLAPGATNELIIGVPWIADEETYPCPSMKRLFDADDLAQNLFDNCFRITNGPDAPDLDIVELDRKLTIVLTNDEQNSNNAFQRYAEVDLRAPESATDTVYRFEGYKVFQLINPNVTDLDDPQQARLIFQSDIRNGVGEIYNWIEIPNPNNPTSPVYEPVPQVEAGSVDQGIRTVFTVTLDQFGQGNSRLVNHKAYYFKAVTYAYNNFEDFNPLVSGGSGQPRPYLEGRRNVRTYVGVPRPITDTRLNGEDTRGVVTRLDGLGTGLSFLDLAGGERERLLALDGPSPILYQEGQGPIEARVFNPFVSQDGTYQVIFSDRNMSDDVLSDNGEWRLIKRTADGDSVIVINQSFAQFSESVVGTIGISISLGQVAEPGVERLRDNGCIGYEVDQTEGAVRWYNMIPNKFNELARLSGGGEIFNFVRTGDVEPEFELDQGRGLTDCFNGEWQVFKLTTGENEISSASAFDFISPMLRRNTVALKETLKLADLNNVDIVFTPDTALWSRCVILESASASWLNNSGLSTDTSRQFELRYEASVSKRADAFGRPIPDGDGRGMGWFPGYAIDVESGQRLNIFFSENSAITADVADAGNPYVLASEDPNSDFRFTGRDMMFNPTTELITTIPDQQFLSNLNVTAGGQHFVYVTREPYDSCAELRRLFDRGRGGFRPETRDALSTVTYAGLMLPLTEFNSYGEGLIPSEVVVKLRVTNPYQVAVGAQGEDDRDYSAPTGINQGYPAYEFTLAGVEAESLLETHQDSILSLINVVPNPYYGYSEYEISEFSNLIRITNLPARAIVTIYTLDGKFIRRYTRAEEPQLPSGTTSAVNNRGVVRQQIYPSLDWDMKNGLGIPVSSGVYLIHVDAGELGQRTLKSFIIQRAFDPAGL